MSQKVMKTTGWVLTLVLALLFTMSAFLKLTQNETALAQAAAIGIGASTYQLIGVIEVISLILFIVPRTGVLGSLLLIAYMGGAIVTHLEHQQPIAMAVAVQVLLWITAALRFPELRQRLLPTRQAA
ncbi:DoxX family protein [Rhabdobacter roseus]|uniref:Putative membrane protein YphA (DoxX/SURF4 family) n=1 Tax=Rhabdobacter roseus TaxID=1655419 RepID=A0A840TJK4_9BACT|nr:DoxX family protein [Rhabdobacter roseus]MBB5283115.1 putative membrane protein YphA (DoxX/SURF4 family) [Rhabdobacter roseus]